MRFDNKVVLVIGASRGFGASTAIKFAENGANVVIVARDETNLKKIATECEKYSQTLIIKADISKCDESKTIIPKTIEKFKKLDVLVNNAAVVKFCTLFDKNLMNFYDETMNTNLRPVFQITNMAVPFLKETKGNVINISGTGSVKSIGLNMMLMYVSEVARDHFTRCAALELAPFGIRINSVNPGPVRTTIFEHCGFNKTEAASIMNDLKKRTALKKLAEPEEIADLILYLASDKAKSITGSIYFIDNGILLSH